MLKNTYSVTSDRDVNLSWEIWINETAGDDNRRYEALKEVCQGKSVLEFGCGNGGAKKNQRHSSGCDRNRTDG